MENPCVELCETMVCVLDKHSGAIFNGLGILAGFIFVGFIWWLLFRR